MSYLDRIATCRRWDPAAYRPFVIEDRAMGRVRHEFARCLADHPKVFAVSERAMARAGQVPDRGYYFDILEFEKYHQRSQTPTTACIPLMYGLAGARDEEFFMHY